MDLSLQNKTFIILISLTDPYGMRKESSTILTGNDRYEGFGIDIIDRISHILGFNYTLQVESDYGSKNKDTGRWSGMLGKLMADVSIGSSSNLFYLYSFVRLLRLKSLNL